MFQLFYKYLILNKKASVPGLGVFFIERKPARLDFANKVFLSPALQIVFEPKPSLTDNRMYSFISLEQKIEETEAVSRYYEFANNIKEKLNQNRNVTLPGIGILSQSADGELSFQATTFNQYFPDAVAERVLRKNTEHAVLVGEINRTNTEMKEMLVQDVSPAKDNWWVFAIVLGVVGIASLLYYYLHNGSLR